MSKLEFLNSHIKNAKINTQKLKNILLCFTEDLTASQTAERVDLSRQTINNYYKIIRTYLIARQNITDSILLQKDSFLQKKSINLNYLKFNKKIIYYIEYNNRIFLLEKENKNLTNIYPYISNELKFSLLKHKRASSAKLLYNTYEKKYFIANFLKDSNSFDIFLNERLKKFRGINKNNYKTHIQESFIRFNNDKTFLFNSLEKFFNL
ncbi:hypothetical protein [Halarcobacter anaerophilus]|uniref:Transposase n=1 Tax=Halarcobacter anaerophilus TaxID=877500 RepID=A0A4Q0XVC1_9BACT|nr:hypothetical protein [Halarcobacter anaerophilus]QDF28010.1 hypothetical protein AANAER_0508 [Halarcobacter anaerophilus]RXJ61446.1 hypothetical protein CRV06_13550 [Halarcobacter anaerophilus]